MLAVVRESIFSIAAPWLPGGRVLDLFAGAGSLGLEAASRGADRVRAFETGRGARAALQAHVEALGLGERVELVARDALDPAGWGEGPFDLVFLDPPFPLLREAAGRERLRRALEGLVARALDPEGLVVLHVERSLALEADLPPALARTHRDHGDQRIWYLQPRSEPEDGAEPGPQPGPTS